MVSNEIGEILQEDIAGIKRVTLNVKRTVTVKSVKFNNRWYTRTRDIAALLGIKQPFEFCADIKRALGEEAVLKYEDTKSFRLKEDLPRTTYVCVDDVLIFLEEYKIFHKLDGKKKRELLSEIRELNRSN